MTTRAIWTQSYSNRTAAAIDETIGKALAMGADTILLGVHEGGAHYDSAFIEPNEHIETGLDPLGRMIELTHNNGITVQPWLNVGYDVYAVDPSTQIYFADVNASWANFALPAARQALVAIIDDIVAKYDVDGVHLDHIRYPHTTDPRASKDDVNLMVQIAYQATQAYSLPLTAAVASNPSANGQRMHQHWDEWLDGGYVDLCFAMCYYGTDDDHKLTWEYDLWPLQHIDRLGVGLRTIDGDAGPPKPLWHVCDELEILRQWGIPHFAIFDSREASLEHLDKISRAGLDRGDFRAVSFNPNHRKTAIVIETANDSLFLRHNTDPWGNWQGIAGLSDEQVQALLPTGVWCHKNTDGVWSLRVGESAPDWQDITHPDDGEEIEATADEGPGEPDPPQLDYALLARLWREQERIAGEAAAEFERVAG